MASPDRVRLRSQELKHLVELVQRGLSGRPHESVGERDEQLTRAVAVDVRIGPAQIAQCLLDSVRACFQEEPLVIRARARDGDGQTSLEGHIEPRRAAAGKLDPAEVVKRVATRRDQLQDAIEPSRWPGNLEGCSREQPEAREPRDEGDE